MADKMDVAIGVAVGAAVGFISGGAFSNVSSMPGPVWAQGTCAKEFGPEAQARGYIMPANPKAVTLTANLESGTCTATFADGKGGKTTFTWEANKPSSAASAASGPTP